MAFDLLATPPAFRIGHKPGASIDFHGKVLDTADDSAAVARRMVDELEASHEVVRGLDEVDRALTEADLDHDTNPELRRLRRYESALHNRLRWTIKQMTFQGPLGNPDPALRPVWRVEEAPAEHPEPKHAEEKAAEAHDPTLFSPPFCLTPDEFPPPGQKADVPAIVKSRKKKRAVKDQARREANRRKAKDLQG